MYRLIFVCAIVLQLASVARSESVAQVIVRKLGLRATPRSTQHVNDTVGLITFSKRDLKNSPARGKHAVVAVSGGGDVIGVVLRPSGVPVCEFGGIFDGQCLTLSGCVSGTSCLQ